MELHDGRSKIAAATVLAIGLVAGAFVLGMQLKHIRSGRQTIAVKGLADVFTSHPAVVTSYRNERSPRSVGRPG